MLLGGLIKRGWLIVFIGSVLIGYGQDVAPPRYRCKGPNCDPTQRALHKKKKYKLLYPIVPQQFDQHYNTKKALRFTPKPYVVSYKKLNRKKQRHARRMQRRIATTRNAVYIRHYPSYLDKQRPKPIAPVLKRRDYERFSYEVQTPKHRSRSEQFRYKAVTMKHHERWERQRSSLPQVKHSNRSERFRYGEVAVKHHGKWEQQRSVVPQVKHNARKWERQRSRVAAVKHHRAWEQQRFLVPQVKHDTRKWERQRAIATTIRHRYHPDDYRYRPYRLRHRKRWRRFRYAPLSIRHTKRWRRFQYELPAVKHHNLAEPFCLQPYRIKHYPEKIQKGQCGPPVPKHKIQIEKSPCFAVKVRHKDFEQFSCGHYRVKHRIAPDKMACGKYEVKHKNFERLRCGKVEVKHKHYAMRWECGKYEVKHRNYVERVRCGPPQVKHRPLTDYKMYTDPSMGARTNYLEKLGYQVRYWLTPHRSMCKLSQVYSSVSAGMIVPTSEYGDVVVVDYVLKNHVIWYRVRRSLDDSTRFKIKKRKQKAIHRLVVLVLNDKRPRKRDGSVNFKRVKLSPEETKQILIYYYLKKDRIDLLTKAYPEEQKNLEILKYRYGYKRRFPPPLPKEKKKEEPSPQEHEVPPVEQEDQTPIWEEDLELDIDFE